MKPEQLKILQHSIGADQYGQGGGFRNHYVAGGRDVALCRELENMGFMKEYPMAPELTGGSPCFTVTAKGKEAIAQHSPAKPPELKRTRAQQRYRDYCHSEYGDSFADFLGIETPRAESMTVWVCEPPYTKGCWEWRWRYKRITRSQYHWDWDVVEGAWCATKKEAKASYKDALARRKHGHPATRSAAVSTDIRPGRSRHPAHPI